MPHAPNRPQQTMHIKGQGIALNLKTKVALKFTDQHGRTLVIRDAKSKGHRGMTTSNVYTCCHPRPWRVLLHDRDPLLEPSIHQSLCV